MVIKMNSDLLNQLVTSFSAAKDEFEYVSLRIFKEDSEIKFFLSNLRPRKHQRPSPCSTPKQDAKELVVEPQSPVLNIQGPAATKRTRGRPPRKRIHLSQSSTPEIPRNDEPSQTSSEVSVIENERSLSFISNIPCLNFFEALSVHEDGPEEGDEKVEDALDKYNLDNTNNIDTDSQTDNDNKHNDSHISPLTANRKRCSDCRGYFVFYNYKHRERKCELCDNAYVNPANPDGWIASCNCGNICGICAAGKCIPRR